MKGEREYVYEGVKVIEKEKNRIVFSNFLFFFTIQVSTV